MERSTLYRHISLRNCVPLTHKTSIKAAFAFRKGSSFSFIAEVQILTRKTTNRACHEILVLQVIESSFIMHTKFQVLMLSLSIVPAMPIPFRGHVAADNAVPELVARQVCGPPPFTENCGTLPIKCPYDKIVSEPKGQAYEHWQVTQPNYCDKESCLTGKSVSHTFGVSVGINAQLSSSIVGGVGISGQITWEWTSGEDYQCYGSGDEPVCTWVKMAYTKYDVSVNEKASCNNDPRVIKDVKFPNKDNNGGNYYCVHGKQFCRNINSHWWEE